MWEREASNAAGGVRHRCRDDAVVEEEEEEDVAVGPVDAAVAPASVGSTPVVDMMVQSMKAV